MASRTPGHVVGPPVAPDKPARADYDTDFYSWSLEQARLLRESRWAQVDRENVAEEIESLGREQFNKLESALRVLLIHLLKWDHQSERRSRSWVLSVEAQRDEIENILADNPGLAPRVAEAIARAYRRARIEAAKETGLEKTAFPEVCAYGLDEMLSRNIGL
ncbi:MAG TPA: DUF29 domain-containing protein [Xanthobacteraceae bacterium]|nr:DUF29 domain-containing protein [Xanthobacteraceae bacterium]